MVVFTCNFCGDAVKKPKAEKHISLECKKKRNGFASLCCIDCLQDFNAQNYHSHTKCMTEEERYSAPGFKPKPSARKGEQKQSSWVDVAQSVLEKANLSMKQRSLLEAISSHENIPRKKIKFVNFIKNSSITKNVSPALIDDVFELIESEYKARSTTADSNPAKGAQKPNTNGTEVSPKAEPKVEDNQPVENKAEKANTEGSQEAEPKVKDESGETAEVSKKKKKSKSKSEESSKVLEKENTEPAEKPSIEESHQTCDGIVDGCNTESNEVEGFTEVKSKKKKKDKKNVDIPTDCADSNKDVEMKVEGATNNDSISESTDRVFAKSRGKKKYKNKESISVDAPIEEKNENVEPVNTDVEMPLNTDPDPVEEKSEEKPERKKKKRKLNEETEDLNSKKARTDEDTIENETSPQKFSWDVVVKTILEHSKDHEMSMKRLTKKVVGEYQSLCSSEKSFDEIAKKFHKKVKKLPFVIVSKDRVQLYVE